MKKDIEWLKKEIGTEMIELEPIRKERWADVKYQTLRSVGQKICQLDEPEVLSQEWIDENKEARINNLRKRTKDDVVPVEKLQNLLVPKQELPVIPKYVADWIEEVKPYKSLRVAFEYIAQRKRDNHDDELAFWIEEGNSETFARAWLDGYEVEEELLYYAKLKEIKPPENEWLTNLSGPNYYAIDKEGLMLGEFVLNLVGMKTEASTYTLKDWERHGINDSNADFVKVDEELN